MSEMKIKEGRLSIYYYILLFLLSMSNFIFYSSEYANLIKTLSFVVQQFILFISFLLIDFTFESKRVKFSAAGLSLIYTVFIIVNSIILSGTSITLAESMRIFALGGDFFYSMNEAGFNALAFIGLIVGIISLFALGGYGNRYIPGINVKNGSFNKLVITVIMFLLMIFVVEQSISRDSADYFSRREYPLYFEIFSTGEGSFKVDIPKRVPELMKGKYIRYIKKAENPKNIIFFVLESFRRDMIDEKIAPDMYNLYKNSLQFDRAIGDSIYTSLSWNTLFMDRPVFTLEDDIDRFNKDSSGSLPMIILKKAGYTTWVSSSANFKWNGFYKRIMGKQKVIDKYFCSYDNFEDKSREIRDEKTIDKAISWINKKDSRKDKPYALFIQVDSTHWTYYFDKKNEIFKPFAESINMAKLTNQEGIDPVFNRYKNSVKEVNNSIARITKTLSDAGTLDDTVITIVTDHGEGFAPGRIGHSVLHKDIMDMALVMQLPGYGTQRVPYPVSHKDIFPTIFDYLKIKGIPSGLLLGRSFFAERSSEDPILTFHGSLEMAVLTFLDVSVFFRTDVTADNITFTPFRLIKPDGKVVPAYKHIFYKLKWQGALKKIVSGANLIE